MKKSMKVGWSWVDVGREQCRVVGREDGFTLGYFIVLRVLSRALFSALGNLSNLGVGGFLGWLFVDDATPREVEYPYCPAMVIGIRSAQRPW